MLNIENNEERGFSISEDSKLHLRYFVPTLISIVIFVLAFYALRSLGRDRNKIATERRADCAKIHDWEKCANENSCQPEVNDPSPGFTCKKNTFYMLDYDIAIIASGLGFMIMMCLVYVGFHGLSKNITYKIE